MRLRLGCRDRGRRHGSRPLRDDARRQDRQPRRPPRQAGHRQLLGELVRALPLGVPPVQGRARQASRPRDPRRPLQGRPRSGPLVRRRLRGSLGEPDRPERGAVDCLSGDGRPCLVHGRPRRGDPVASDTGRSRPTISSASTPRSRSDGQRRPARPRSRSAGSSNGTTVGPSSTTCPSPSERARSSPCSAPTGPARRRPWRSSRAIDGPTAVRCGCSASTRPAMPRRSGRGRASCSRRAACIRR